MTYRPTFNFAAPPSGTLHNGKRVIKTATSEEISDILHSCHWIPALRGHSSAAPAKFAEYPMVDLIQILRSMGAIVKSQHFSGWQPAQRLGYVVFYADRTSEAIFVRKTTRTGH
jgi:hypothetical protein